MKNYRNPKRPNLSVLMLMTGLLFAPGALSGQGSPCDPKPRLLYGEFGMQAGLPSAAYLSLTYIHPQGVGLRLTGRAYSFTPHNRPDDFVPCTGFNLFQIESDPNEHAYYVELSAIRRIATPMQWVTLSLEGGVHYSNLLTFRYWKSNPQSQCYGITYIHNNLFGVNARLGVQMAIFKFLGFQAGLNGMYNVGKMVFGPEFGVMVGRIR